MRPENVANVPRSFPWLIVAGVLVAALSMRGPIVSPTPVLQQISDQLGLTSGAAGLLTLAPVLTFAAVTPIAALVVRRSGAERALLLSLSGVLLGTLVRALPGYGSLLIGMVLIGASITIGNVVIPVIIRREVAPSRVASMTAVYAATLNVGSVITSAGTAPLAAVWGWSLALLFWSVITVAGIGLWSSAMLHSGRAGRQTDQRGSERIPEAAPQTSTATGVIAVDPATITGPMPVIGRRRRIRPIAWLLMAAFGAQCFGYYALTTWLPTFASDQLGVTSTAAGALASIFQGAGIVGALIIPVLARYTPQLVPALTVSVCWLVLVLGLLLAPQLLVLWMVFGAFAHAGGFVVIFTVLVRAARSDADAAGMSALVQAGGYSLGALGAPLVGLGYQLSGGWTAPLLLVLVVVLGYAVALLAAVRSAPGR